MRQECGLAQHQFAHCFQVVQSAAVTAFAQHLAHLGKRGFGLVAQREQGFGASERFACLGHSQHFVGRHGMRAWLARIPPISAIGAVVPAQIGKR